MSTFVRVVFSIALAGASLAGCGGLQSPIGTPAGIPQSGSIPASARHGGFWRSPAARSGAPLLYVTDGEDGDVYALALPKGHLVRRLTGFGFPSDDCADKKGDVFVVDAIGDDIREFRHGAKQPFKVLNDSGYSPFGCSIDPTTNNLAVTNFSVNSGSSSGNVAIYTRARGKPAYYSDASIFFYGYCSYDGAGDLFIDGGTPPSDNPQVAELPKGSQNFTAIKLNQSLGGNNVSPLQWDGTYLAIASQDSAVIYQFQISGGTGTKVSSTKLKGSTGVGAFYIDGSTLYAPATVSGLSDVGEYRYPSGGKPLKRFYAVVNPYAVTLSTAP